MLDQFIIDHRTDIISRCRARIASRPAPRPTDAELLHGVPLFLDQLVDTLRRAQATSPAIGPTAALHGRELLHHGFSVAQVVHDYGGICQSITELAVELDARITAQEFQILNLSLDNAIAEAVSEFARLREHEGTERMGRLAHELRNQLNTAALSFEMLQKGNVGVHGSTGMVLASSLAGLRRLIDRELAEVRLGGAILDMQDFALSAFIEDLEVSASIEASVRGLRLSVPAVEPGVRIRADRQVLASVVSNLLNNAFKYTRPDSLVSLRTRSEGGRTCIDVEDECGGLPAGKADDLFRPYAQRSADRSGLGLGLSIARRGAEANLGTLTVKDAPGRGCTFTVSLPRLP